MRKFKISGVPICDGERRLVGIITNRDMRFLVDHNVKIKDVMTRDNLITAPGRHHAGGGTGNPSPPQN